MPPKKPKNKEPSEPEDVFQSHHMAEKTTDEPLIRVMALHDLAYCERLFYLEEVEEIRVADANVYSGRRMHEISLGNAVHRKARGGADCLDL